MDRVRYMRGGSDGAVHFSDALAITRPRHGDTWGRWKLNGRGNHWSLDLEDYFISLNGITSSAQMNDWLFQMAGKTWVTVEDLGNLVLAFDDIFEPQATLCGSGVDKRLRPDYVNTILGDPLGDAVPDEDESSD